MIQMSFLYTCCRTSNIMKTFDDAHAETKNAYPIPSMYGILYLPTFTMKINHSCR